MWKTNEDSYDDMILDHFAAFKRGKLPYNREMDKFLEYVGDRSVLVYVHFERKVISFDCTSMGMMCKYIEGKIELKNLLFTSSEDMYRLFTDTMPFNFKGLPKQEIACITDCFTKLVDFKSACLENEKIFRMMLRAIGMEIVTVVTIEGGDTCPNKNCCCTLCYPVSHPYVHCDYYRPDKKELVYQMTGYP